MKGLFAGFQINVLPYKENIPKMKKLCLTSHVVDDKMESGLQQDTCTLFAST